MIIDMRALRALQQLRLPTILSNVLKFELQRTLGNLHVLVCECVVLISIETRVAEHVDIFRILGTAVGGIADSRDIIVGRMELYSTMVGDSIGD